MTTFCCASQWGSRVTGHYGGSSILPLRAGHFGSQAEHEQRGTLLRAMDAPECGQLRTARAFALPFTYVRVRFFLKVGSFTCSAPFQPNCGNSLQQAHGPVGLTGCMAMHWLPRRPGTRTHATSQSVSTSTTTRLNSSSTQQARQAACITRVFDCTTDSKPASPVKILTRRLWRR